MPKAAINGIDLYYETKGDGRGVRPWCSPTVRVGTT